MQTQQSKTNEPIILEDITLRIPFGPTGYYQEGRDLFYKRVTVDGGHTLREDRTYPDEILTLSIGNSADWRRHFEQTESGKIVPPLPLWVAITERLYEQKHPALDGLIKDFREEGLSAATTIRYAGSHIVHDFGSEQIRVHCYVPLTIEVIVSYDKVKDREAWRKVFQGLLLTADLDKTMGILQEIYGEVSFNVYDNRENERACNVPVRIHSRAFGRVFEINGVPDLYSTSDLHRVHGVRLEKLCLAQEVA